MRARLASWPGGQGLRKWQERALAAFLTAGQDFLAVGTPGAGKTKFGLRAAHQLLQAGEVDHLVVLCPTAHLKRQWAESAHAVGIELDPEWSNATGAIARDMHGVAVTYAQVAAAPHVHRHHCDRRRTLVIFDEIHHAGDEKSWGAGIREAFEPALRRLCLSGTPFRSDDERIPFVAYEKTYDEYGQPVYRSIPDFTYGYADALEDGVCRHVYFPKKGGSTEWWYGADVVETTFDDDLSPDQIGKRLVTALDLNGEWIYEVLEEADEKLSTCRADGHPYAGGLVIARDQEHARGIADILSVVTGEDPALAISEEPDASDAIDQFAKGRGRWIVAVQMVSEGVDIPRLRVGVYATTKTTELFFRQAVGRFVRLTRGSDGNPDPEWQDAHLFIPADPRLLRIAKHIKDERDHQLRMEVEEEGERPGGERSLLDQLFQPKDASSEDRGIIHDGLDYSPDKIQVATQLHRELGLPLSFEPAKLIQIIEATDGRLPGLDEGEVEIGRQAEPDGRSLYQQKKELRNRLHRLVNRLHYITGDERSHIHKRLQDWTDGVKVAQAEAEALRDRIRLVTQWITDAEE